MEHLTVYWIDCPALGRLGIVSCPSGEGFLESEVEDLKAQRVSAVASLLTHSEEYKYKVEAEQLYCKWHELRFLSFPISDHGVPNDEQEAFLFSLKVKAWVEQGESVVIHSFAGLGRSPMMVAASMVLMGYTVAVATEKIESSMNLRVPELNGQVEWLHWFAAKRRYFRLE